MSLLPSANPDSVWRAPLLPAALTFTAGMLLDRWVGISLPLALAVALAGVIGWVVQRRTIGLVWLALAVLALGAARHRVHRDVYDAVDIGLIAPAQPLPAQVVGVLDEEPTYRPTLRDDPLRSRDRADATTFVLRATRLRARDEWLPVSGRLRLIVAGDVGDLHPGDEVEAVGLLSRMAGPANPGEHNQASYWRDRRVCAQLVVRKTSDGLTRYERGWTTSWRGWLATVRGHGQRALGSALPGEVGGVAQALLLGEGSTLGSSGWEKFVRTGVIHILVVAGHHLVVLGAVAGWLLRRFGVRLRYAAGMIGLFLVAYALLTGGHPPALRAAITVGAICLGMVLRRPTLYANLLALAWLLVAIVQPADIFGAGCQLSFLSVVVLNWGCRRPPGPDPDPLDQFIERSKPALVRAGKWLLFTCYEAYRVTFLVWLAVTPLTAAHTNLVPLIGILLLPPLMLLATFALLAGFAFLLVDLLASPLAAMLIPLVRYPLATCVWLVDRTAPWPCSYVYVGEIPQWWLWPTCIGLLLGLTCASFATWRLWVPLGLAWLCVGLVAGSAVLPPDELRITFVAVGHGGCTVIETPDGRTLLYDVGAISGPEIASRQVAPFLWSRGVRRIDEIFLSHADLDHFNGVVDLLDRFPIGQVTCTPTFADKNNTAIRHTLAELARRGVPVRIVKAGDRLAAGGVILEVLHPPGGWPRGQRERRSPRVVGSTRRP